MKEKAYSAEESTPGTVSLKDRIRDKGPLSWEDAVATLLPVMKSLEELHKNGLLNLSVSPETILIGGDGEISFSESQNASIAELAGMEPDTETAFPVREGYSAPELVFNDSVLGPWTDVYSVGAVFVYCLTGKAPAGAARRVKAKKDSVSSGIPDLSLEKESMIEKAMAVSPQVRFQTVEDMEQTLQKYSARKSLSRSFGGMAVYSVLILAVIVFFHYYNGGGQGKNSARFVSEINEDAAIPTPYPGLQAGILLGLSTGGEHTAMIAEDGSLWMTGKNSSGELGDASGQKQTTPVRIAEDVRSADTAWEITAFVKSDDTLWMCGSNEDGQFGNGTKNASSSPVCVMEDVMAVNTGWKETAIVKKDGSLWACGYNDSGQLGNGSTADSSSFVRIMDDVSSVSVGWKQMAIVKNDGTLWTCGRNDSGQLGDGTTQDRYEPVQVMEDVAQVSVSWKQMAVLKKDGTLWSCGKGENGQLGTGSTRNESTPVQIMDNVRYVSAGFKELAILKEDGTLWTCGLNDCGQLGTGSTSDHSTPVMVMDHVVSCSVGTDGRVLAAVRDDGTIWTCGSNEKGALGNGTTKDSLRLSMISLG